MPSEGSWLTRLAEQARVLREEPFARFRLRGAITHPYWRLRLAHLGEGAVLDRPKWIYGPGHISVGDRAFIFWGAWLSVERPAWTNPEPALKIGNGVVLRPFCTISCAESVTLEDDVAIGSFSTIIDNDHVMRGEEGENITWSQAWHTTPIRIGRGTWIGDRVSILRGSDIGRQCVVGTNSVVRGTLPDFAIAVGSPARVVGDVRERADRHSGEPVAEIRPTEADGSSG